MKTRIFALAMPASALQASTYTLPYLPVSVLTLTAIYDAPAFGIPAPFLGSGGSDVEVWQFDHRDGHVVAHASFFLAWNVLTPPGDPALWQGPFPVSAVHGATSATFEIIEETNFFTFQRSSSGGGSISFVETWAASIPAALPLFAAGLGIVTFLARRRKTMAVSST